MNAPTIHPRRDPRALRPLRRMRQAGMTLVEIMIVIVIMALIGTGVTLALLPSLERARIKDTETAAQTVRSAVTMFRAENPGDGCPDMQDLMEGQYIDSDRRTVDAWENDFEIECDGRNTSVVSAGPDGQFGNDDDVD